MDDKAYIGSINAGGLYVLDLNTSAMEMIEFPKKYIVKNLGVHIQGLVKYDDAHFLFWIPSKFYLFNRHTEEIEEYKHQLSEGSGGVQKIEIRHGKMWISGRSCGFQSIDIETGVINDYSDRLALDKDHSVGWVNRIYFDSNDRVWISRGKDKYYSYLDLKTDSIWNAAHLDNKTNYSLSEGFIEDSEGKIWVCGDFGFGYLDDSLNSTHVYDGFFKGVAPYKEDQFWLVGRKLELYDVINKKVKNFSFKYGLSPHRTTRNIITISDSLSIIGCINGIAVFNPEAFKLHSEKPIPYVRRILINNEEYPINENLIQAQHFDLPKEATLISFDVKAKAYRLPEIKMEYRFEDSEWFQNNISEMINFSGLKHGNYQLEIRVKNNSAEAPVFNTRTFTFNIEPYWYQSLLFKIAITGLGLLLIWLFYKNKINQVKREAQLKSSYELKLAETEMQALRSQMNPHFLFNSLNAIDHFIVKNDSIKASDYLNRFSKLIRQILQNSKKKLIPLNDELDVLRLYIELESLRFNESFDYKINIDKTVELSEATIPPMLIQPYVENAIWHGLMHKKGERKLTVNLSKTGEYLKIAIIDNGIGRSASAALKSRSALTQKSLGTKLTSDRIESLNKLNQSMTSVIIDDNFNNEGNNNGTIVTLLVTV